MLKMFLIPFCMEIQKFPGKNQIRTSS